MNELTRAGDFTGLAKNYSENRPDYCRTVLKGLLGLFDKPIKYSYNKQHIGLIMSHSVEEYYRKIDVLHERAIELHRERYKTTGEFDEARPSTVKRFTSLVSDAEYIEIPNAGHASSIDNPQVLIKAHRDFANRLDKE